MYNIGESCSTVVKASISSMPTLRLFGDNPSCSDELVPIDERIILFKQQVLAEVVLFEKNLSEVPTDKISLYQRRLKLIVEAEASGCNEAIRHEIQDDELVRAILSKETEEVKRQIAVEDLRGTTRVDLLEKLCYEGIQHENRCIKLASARAMLGRELPGHIVAWLVDVGLTSNSHEIKIASATALGGTSNPYALTALCNAGLRDTDERSRNACITSLTGSTDPECIKLLCTAVREDSSPTVRAGAAIALSKSSDPLAKAALLDTLDDIIPGVRGAAATALGDHLDVEVVEALCAKGLKDRGEWVRIRSIVALSECRDSSCLDALLEVAQSDSRPPVQVQAEEAIKKIRRRLAPKTGAK